MMLLSSFTAFVAEVNSPVVNVEMSHSRQMKKSGFLKNVLFLFSAVKL